MRHLVLAASALVFAFGLTARANELDSEKQYSTQQIQMAQALPKTLVMRVKIGTNKIEIMHSNVALPNDASAVGLVSTSSFIPLDKKGNPVRELDKQSSTSSFGFHGGGGFGGGGRGGGFGGGGRGFGGGGGFRGGFGGGGRGFGGGGFGRGGFGGGYGRGFGGGYYGGYNGYYGGGYGGFYPNYLFGGYTYPYQPYYGYENNGYYYSYYGYPYGGYNPYCTTPYVQ